MTATELITVETNTRFSESLLWQIEAEYFERQGINAWTGAIPFFITSNPFTADCYAKVMIRFMQDYAALPAAELDKPFYIIELGAGTGQFSFYCLKRLMYLKQQFQLDHVKICYVMADFVKANVDFWQQQPVLKPFVDDGVLDFANFDLEAGHDIVLQQRGMTLSTETVANPIMVIANYVFDSTRHDAFHMQKNKVCESLVSLRTSPQNVTEGKPIRLEKTDVHFSYHDIDPAHYYEDETWNGLLTDCQEKLSSGNFCIPVGMLRCLKQLQSFSNNRLMLLASDKAYTRSANIANRGDPYMAFHDNAFSVTVNFYSVGRYFEQHGGVAIHQPSSDAINTSVFIMGATLDDLPQTQVAIESALHQFGPGDYFRMHRFLREQTFDLRMCLTQLHVCYWDPYVLSVHADSIGKALGDANARVIRGFVEGMSVVADQLYPTPKMRDHYFNIAMVYHVAKCYREAITYYQKSLDWHFAHQKTGNYFLVYYNLGCCYHQIGDNKQAIAQFEQADQLEEGDNNQARQWLQRLKHAG